MIELWKHGSPVIQGDVLAIDTETELIKDHTIPPVVTLQVSNGRGVDVVGWENIPEYLDILSRRVGVIYVFHNAAFDVAVLGYPKFLLQAAARGNIVDTMFRYSLFQLEHDGFLTQRSLEHVCKVVLGETVSKDEDIRLTFTRAETPSQRHLEYARLDPLYTWRVANTLRSQPTEDIQVRGAIALDDISRRGFLVDEERRASLNASLETECREHLIVLEDNGYIPGAKGNAGVLQDYLLRLENRFKIKLPRTEKTGRVQTSEEAILSIGDAVGNDPFLNAFKAYAHLNKIISTYLREDVVGSDGRVHTRFNPMLVTGRTSSSAPNVQNLPREGGIRGIFIPPADCWLAAVDYCQLELCTLAQTILLRQGKSVLAEKIAAGVDVHKYLAALVFKKDIESVTKKERQNAKIANFGSF
jgi:DNA polymerase I-like protein with 3'-5' exonuclease and polymerase domains